ASVSICWMGFVSAEICISTIVQQPRRLVVCSFSRFYQFREVFRNYFALSASSTYVVVFTSRLTDFCGSMGLSLLGAVFPKAVTTRPPLSSNKHGQRFSSVGGLVDQNG